MNVAWLVAASALALVALRECKETMSQQPGGDRGKCLKMAAKSQWKNYSFRTRVWNAKKNAWICPRGWTDTGCGWEMGKSDWQKKQCRRQKAGCTKDTDCSSKGACVNGKCVNAKKQFVKTWEKADQAQKTWGAAAFKPARTKEQQDVRNAMSAIAAVGTWGDAAFKPARTKEEQNARDAETAMAARKTWGDAAFKPAQTKEQQSTRNAFDAIAAAGTWGAAAFKPAAPAPA